MLKDKIFREVTPSNNRTLYVSVTNKCQLHCPFCFNKFVEGFKNDKKELTPRKVIDLIKENDYASIDLLGGEPLLNPEFIIDIVNSFKNSDKSFCISSNLAFKSLSTLQLEALWKIQKYSISKISIGSSYNLDRFESTNYFNLWKKNMIYLDELGINVGVTVTLTEKQCDQPVDDLISILESVKYKSVNLEICKYSKPQNEIELEHIKQVSHKVDLYLKECFEKIPIYKNYQFGRFYDSIINRVPLADPHCSYHTDIVFPDDTLKHGCCSNGVQEDDSELLKKKIFENNCLVCDFYDFCKGDCECSRWTCVFPKKTLKYVQELIWREYK